MAQLRHNLEFHQLYLSYSSTNILGSSYFRTADASCLEQSDCKKDVRETKLEVQRDVITTLGSCYQKDYYEGTDAKTMELADCTRNAAN